jgi:RNA polymerase sigma-70 factor (ECF subfamily)
VSDADLIRSSLTDASAFAGLFDRHFRAIFRFLRGRVGEQLAEDLASETFVVAFRRRHTYDLSRDDARAWLYGIAVNLAREHRRAEARRLRAYARLPVARGDAAEESGERLDPAVAAALLELGDEERDLILLLTWADLTYEQLADALGLPLGTVRSRLSRVRAKLRARLAPTEVAVEANGSTLA